MNKNLCVVVFASALLVSANVIAEEEKSPWTKSAELGLILTTGNTVTQSTSVKVDVVYEEDEWRHTGHFEGYGNSSEDSTGTSVVSAERYKLSGKSDFKLDDTDYVFGLIELNDDRFSGFEYENIISGGYGRNIFKYTDEELDLEIGPGVRLFKVDGGQSDEEVLLRLAGKYWLEISESSKFTQSLTLDVGEEITSIESVSGLTANINNTLALKVTFTLRNKSDVPVGTEETDTETAATVVYTF